MTLSTDAVSVLALIKNRHAYATMRRVPAAPGRPAWSSPAQCNECGYDWPCPTYRTACMVENKHDAVHCADPDCPDFGRHDFGEGTCPAEHSSQARV